MVGEEELAEEVMGYLLPFLDADDAVFELGFV